MAKPNPQLLLRCNTFSVMNIFTSLSIPRGRYLLESHIAVIDDLFISQSDILSPLDRTAI